MSADDFVDHDDWFRAKQCVKFQPFGDPYVTLVPEDQFQELGLKEYVDGILGGEDADEDAIPNLADNCALVVNAGQEDGDVDGRGDACDCSPADHDAWDAPSDVVDLRFDDGTSLRWQAPAVYGATTVTYDTLRSSRADDFTTPATCVESLGDDLVAVDSTTPTPGGGFYYLIRARNACLGSMEVGTLGTAASGGPRNARQCP